MKLLSASAALLLLGGCAAASAQTETAPSKTIRLPAVEVPASAETDPVATQNADAADDPAIWVRADNKPFAFAGKQVPGVILGTDKKAGLYVFGLDGKVLQFLPEGRLNNVDLRSDGDGFVAVASDRTAGKLGVALYRFTGTGKLEDAGFITTDLGEPYGMCMGRWNGALIAVLIGKDGQVREYTLSGTGTTLTGTERRRFAVGSQSEGCVVDDVAGFLYIGEEDVGVWRYPLAGDPATRVAIGKAGGGALVADVEGMSILADRGKRYLIVSSQGDSAFAVWRVDGTAPAYRGRFRVVPNGKGVDGVSTTDGVDARGGPVGLYARGLVVMQDNDNDGQAQNFKLVDWRDVLKALPK